MDSSGRSIDSRNTPPIILTVRKRKTAMRRSGILNAALAVSTVTASYAPWPSPAAIAEISGQGAASSRLKRPTPGTTSVCRSLPYWLLRLHAHGMSPAAGADADRKARLSGDVIDDVVSHSSFLYRKRTYRPDCCAADHTGCRRAARQVKVSGRIAGQLPAVQ
jgi:hypothetical protein